MKNATQILIAKYAADLIRMEPRNAGVVVWSPEGIVARFLGEQSDGKVRAPGIVPKEDRHAYKEWISYWRIMLSKDEIKSDSGERIHKSSPDFIRILQSKSKSSFMLVDAGFMRGTVNANELSEIANECFDTLVQEPDVDRLREHKMALRKATNEAFEMAGVRSFGDLQRGFSVPCKIRKVPKNLPFDYALLHDGEPLAVFHTVSVPQNASICSASFMFEKLRFANDKKYKHAKKCALILSDDSEAKDDMSSENLGILRLYAKVIDVADIAEAASQIKELIMLEAA